MCQLPPFRPQHRLPSACGPLALHGANKRQRHWDHGHHMSFGQGTLLANFDVKSAYWNIPVHPEDRYLLGMKWQGNYFIDMGLPFGLRSAPFIFSSVADLLEWILRHNYGLNFLLHYLDDFWTLGPPNSPARQNNLDTYIRLFKDWHILLQPNNMEGPSTCLTVLGIELDSLTLQARPPRDKFERTVALPESWSVKPHCSKKELESLIGTLHHACKVLPQGHTFIRWMINLPSAFWCGDHPIRLNQEFHLDLSWWREFFVSWDGRPYLISLCHPTQLELLAMGHFRVMTGLWENGPVLNTLRP